MTKEEFYKLLRPLAHYTKTQIQDRSWDAGYAAGQDNPPEGLQLVPISLLRRCSGSLGAFVGDEGWQQIDMDVMDSIDALLAAPTPGKDKS